MSQHFLIISEYDVLREDVNKLTYILPLFRSQMRKQISKQLNTKNKLSICTKTKILSDEKTKTIQNFHNTDLYHNIILALFCSTQLFAERPPRAAPPPATVSVCTRAIFYPRLGLPRKLSGLPVGRSTRSLKVYELFWLPQ